MLELIPAPTSGLHPPQVVRAILRPCSERIDGAVVLDVAEQQRSIFASPLIDDGEVDPVKPGLVGSIPEQVSPGSRDPCLDNGEANSLTGASVASTLEPSERFVRFLGLFEVLSR